MKKTLIALVGTLAFVCAAEAALIQRGGGMIYDDTLNITWLSDWNYAKTSGYDVDGLMDWATANAWADNLDYAGYTDWRLPVSTGYVGNAAESELGHMFYVNMGANSGNSILSGSNTANLALFTNMRSYYWTASEYAQAPGNAWFYATSEGLQALDVKYDQLNAVAVREGDVGSIPEPASLVLVGIALVGAIVSRRRSSAVPASC